MESGDHSKIAKNTLFLALRMLFVLFVSLYTSRVFLNVLGVVDYGISNIVAGFVSMFSFLNSSLANGIQRFYNAEFGANGVEGITKVYNTALIIQLVIAISVFLLLESLGLWYIYNKMVIPPDRFKIALYLYHFSAISTFIVIMQSPYSAAIMAYEHMNAYAFISIIDVILKLVFAILLPFIKADRLLMYGVFYLIISFINFFFNYFYCKLNFKELYIKRDYSKGMFIDILSFSGWNLLGTFACMAREQGLNLVLNLFFGPIINAARAIAYQVSGALQGFVLSISLASRPQMVQSYAKGDIPQTMNLMFAMSKISFIFLYILAIPIVFNIDYILHLWLGENVPNHAANFIVLIILTNFMNNLNTPLSNVVSATGNVKKYQLTFSIINLLILPISYLALKLGAPAEAAFVTYLFMSVFVQVGCLLVMKNLVSLSLMDYVRRIIMPLFLISITVTPVLYLINNILHEGFSRIILIYVITTLLSTIAFYFIAMDKAEKIKLKSFICKLKE